MTETSSTIINKDDLNFLIKFSHNFKEKQFSESFLLGVINRNIPPEDLSKTPDEIFKDIIHNIGLKIEERNKQITDKIADTLGLKPNDVKVVALYAKNGAQNKKDASSEAVIVLGLTKNLQGKIVIPSKHVPTKELLSFPSTWLFEPFETKIKKHFGLEDKKVSAKKFSSLKL